MAAALENAPWRANPNSAAFAPESMLVTAAKDTITRLPGSGLDDIMRDHGLPGTVQTRIVRVLSLLVQNDEIERWLDHNEQPPAWRYWLKGQRPSTPSPREVRAPAKPKRDEDTEPPAAAANKVKLRELRGSAPPATADEGELTVRAIGKQEKRAAPATPAPAPAAPAALEEDPRELDKIVESTALAQTREAAEKLAGDVRVEAAGKKLEKGEGTWPEVALEYVKQHPGATAKDLTELGVPSAGNTLGQHVRRGKLRCEGEPKAYQYFFIPPEERAPTPVPNRSPPDSLTSRLAEAVRANPGKTSGELAKLVKHEDTIRVANTLSALKREGRVRSEGTPRSFRFYPPTRAAAPKKRAAKKVAPPRARARAGTSQLDVNAIEEKARRVRELRNELERAEADLRALIGGTA